MTGNIISCEAFEHNDPYPTHGSKRLTRSRTIPKKYEFFISSRIETRQSVILDGIYLTRNDGMAYLVCGKYDPIGHLVLYIELLNDIGQIQVTRLELCSELSCSPEEVKKFNMLSSNRREKIKAPN